MIQRIPVRVFFTIGMTLRTVCFLAFVISALRTFIPSVVRVRTKEKVARIYTRRIVAFMQHTNSDGNFASCQCPRNAVRISSFLISIPSFVFIYTPRKMPVTRSSTTRQPKPTFISPTALHMTPEFFCGSHSIPRSLRIR